LPGGTEVSGAASPAGPGAPAPGASSRFDLSLRALTTSLRWLRAQVPAAVGLVSADPDVLERALGRGEALSPELFEMLVRLGLVAFRCARTPGARAVTVGDALTVAAGLPASGDGPSWSFQPGVSPEVFEKLRFRQTSQGMVRIQGENGPGWSEHAQASQGFILRRVEQIQDRSLAVLLGAGRAFDLPVAELARQFDRLVLIDVDEVALAHTIEARVEDPGLRAKIEPRVMDVTGIDGAMVRRIDEAFAAGGSGDEVRARLATLCRSYRLPGGPSLLEPDEHASLMVSGLLLSQVAWPQRSYAHRRFSERFGRPTGQAERLWIAPFWSFELLVQQDHINALTRSADEVVLISDVVNVPTIGEGTGVERDVGLRVCALGVESLAERVPQFLEIGGRDGWWWRRCRPKGCGAPGSRMEVEALVLREPSGPR
jgi:hypothetical protein